MNGRKGERNIYGRVTIKSRCYVTEVPIVRRVKCDGSEGKCDGNPWSVRRPRRHIRPSWPQPDQHRRRGAARQHLGTRNSIVSHVINCVSGGGFTATLQGTAMGAATPPLPVLFHGRRGKRGKREQTERCEIKFVVHITRRGTRDSPLKESSETKPTRASPERRGIHQQEQNQQQKHQEY